MRYIETIVARHNSVSENKINASDKTTNKSKSNIFLRRSAERASCKQEV